eukprot:734541-Hanusia_phi.AAC.4
MSSSSKRCVVKRTDDSPVSSDFDTHVESNMPVESDMPVGSYQGVNLSLQKRKRSNTRNEESQSAGPVKSHRKKKSKQRLLNISRLKREEIHGLLPCRHVQHYRKKYHVDFEGFMPLS